MAWMGVGAPLVRWISGIRFSGVKIVSISLQQIRQLFTRSAVVSFVVSVVMFFVVVKCWASSV